MFLPPRFPLPHFGQAATMTLGIAESRREKFFEQT
jgi:hypothetical protein